jgi:hypothetical protein
VNATRTIPGRPLRGGTAVADTVIELVASTLDPSPYLTAAEIRSELAAARSALALLASGGHLAGDDLVLTAADLRLIIKVPVGESALSASENLSAPRGAATATDWTLHLPSPDAATALAASAASACSHVSIEPAPAVTASTTASTPASSIDLRRLLDGSSN